jgi:hypothetical protein
MFLRDCAFSGFNLRRQNGKFLVGAFGYNTGSDSIAERRDKGTTCALRSSVPTKTSECWQPL